VHRYYFMALLKVKNYLLFCKYNRHNADGQKRIRKPSPVVVL
jgi:hypothetical protein